MTQARGAAALAVLACAAAGCPRLPSPQPRPHAHLVAADREGAMVTARLRVDAAPRLRTVAVDWALALGDRDLVRGRSDSLAIAIRLPGNVRPGALARLRGAVHLDGPDGAALAPFDESLRIP